MMDAELLASLRPEAESSAAIEAAITRGKAALADIERATAARDDGLLRLVMDGAGPIELAAEEGAINAARRTAGMVGRVLAELEARLPAARRREAVARLRELAEKAERASAEAAAAWQGDHAEVAEADETAAPWRGSYAEAAGRIRDLLGLLAAADRAADAFGRATAIAIRGGEIGKEDAPPLCLPARELLGASGEEVGKLIQLPSPEGRLHSGAFWVPAEVLRDTWREAQERRQADAARMEERLRRDAEAQAEAKARFAAMSHDQWKREAGSAVR